MRKIGQKVTRTTASRRARAILPQAPCAICKRPYEVVFEVNHIDRNWQNNELSNLEWLCKSCHATQYAAETAASVHILERMGVPFRKVWEEARTDILSGNFVNPTNSLTSGEFTVDGVRRSITGWSRETGLSESTIRRRLIAGWDLEDVIGKPALVPEKYEYDGFVGNLSQHATRLGLNYGVVYSRVKQYGWSIERALSTPIRDIKEDK